LTHEELAQRLLDLEMQKKALLLMPIEGIATSTYREPQRPQDTNRKVLDTIRTDLSDLCTKVCADMDVLLGKVDSFGSDVQDFKWDMQAFKSDARWGMLDILSRLALVPPAK
jgi:hypothetical protein